MKRILFIACLLAFETAYSQNSTDNKLQQQDTITIKYQVFGMNCPGCHGALEKQLNKIPGVLYSKADWVKQEVAIYSSIQITEEDIRKRMKKTNFTMGEKIK